MEFKIILTADRPASGDLVLAAETPLSGVAFIEEAGRCLRKSIDHLVRTQHITLGALSVYEITVPQMMAVECGLFDEKSTISVIVENDLLSHYIFYGATVSQKSTGRPCYPYMHGQATLCSYIDELQFLEDWANIGYPLRVGWDGGLVGVIQTTTTPTGKPSIGCGGCTCHREPPPPPPEHCDLCAPNMGHNKQPHVGDCDCDTNYRPPHSNVPPGMQHRPGPRPHPHQGTPPRPEPKPHRGKFTFIC